MKKFALFLIAVLGLALAAPADAIKLGKERWQNNTGLSAVDTLNWSDQGSHSLRDTLVVATVDTTTSEMDISGCSYISLWVQASGLNAPTYHNINYVVQISPDGGSWISLASTFSTMNKAATPAADTTVSIVYDKDYAIDTLAARDVTLTMELPVGRDYRLVKAGKYLRVIARPSGGTTGDTTIVKAILRREWPADPK